MQEKLENALPSPLSKKKYYLKSLNLQSLFNWAVKNNSRMLYYQVSPKLLDSVYFSFCKNFINYKPPVHLFGALE